MAIESLKFRCYRCNKLLGVSPKKAGRAVTCPSCQAELIVPEPEPETESEDLMELELDVAPPSGSTPSAPSSGPEFDPFDARNVFVQVDERGNPIGLVMGSMSAPSRVEATPESGPLALNLAPEPDPVIPPIRVDEPASILEREPRNRSRDVQLPRGVVAAWSILVLLAVVSAFAAGLLVGHYVWKLK